MKRIQRFIRTTLVGGIIFLLPLVVIYAILAEALVITDRVVTPLASLFPVKSLIGLEAPKFLGILLILLICFLAGLIAQTAIARDSVGWLETSVLVYVPGYEYIKRLIQNLLGSGQTQAYEVVLFRIENAWQFAFLIERLENNHVAVFVPSAPNGSSGSMYFATEDRIRPVDVPGKTMINCVHRYGIGSKALLEGKLGKYTGSDT